MKVLITGGAGYIGYSLAKRLLNAHTHLEEIVIYDNVSRGNYCFFFGSPTPLQTPMRFIQGDILDSRRLEQAMKGIDSVIHLAARVSSPYADSDAHFFDQVNHWGTANVVNVAEEQGVSNFIHMSSMAVYGNYEEAVSEDTATHPESFYGVSKLHAEEQVARIMPRIHTHIIRSGNVYGYNPVMRMDAVFNRFMFEANFSGRVNINGNGEQRRAFINVEKLAYLLEALLLHGNNVPPGIYNAVEHNISVNEIADEVEKLYPNLERLFISRNMRMSQITAEKPSRLFKHIALPHVGMQEELQMFKQRFCF